MATTDDAGSGARRWRGLNRQEVVRAAGGDGASATAKATRGGVARGGASAGTSDSAGSARASDDEEEGGKSAKGGGGESPSAPRTRAQRMADMLARAKAAARAGISNVPRGSESKAKYGLKVSAEEQENRKRQAEEERVKKTLLALQMGDIRSKPSGFDVGKLTTFLDGADESVMESDTDSEDEMNGDKYEDDVDEHRSMFVMHPTTKVRQYWDFLQVFLLLYIAIAVPYRIGFSELSYGWWYAIDFVVDTYFYIDMVFNFFTAYWEISETDDDYHYVTNLWQIQKHYLQGWFVPDLISLAPVDYVSRLIDGTATCSWESEAACGDAAVATQVPEMLRLLRLVRLLRMARTTRILERYQETLMRVYKTVTIVRLIALLCLLSHWMACLYAYVYNFEREDASGVEGKKSEMYVAALFWSVQTLTTVGYGNVVPTTVDERVVAIIVMITGGFVFSAIISGVNMSMDEDSPGNRFALLMNHVRTLLLENKMPSGLKARVRSHYKNSARAQKLVNRDIIQPLPEAIRADVNFYIYGKSIMAGLKCAGTIEPSGLVLEILCRTMDTVIYQRGTRMCYPYELAEKIIITLNGRTSYSPDEATAFTHDMAQNIKRKKLRQQQIEIAEEKGWIRGPGTVLNPGLMCGFHKGILCAMPFDKAVEALCLDSSTLYEMLTQHQPKLVRNFIDEFLQSLKAIEKPKMARVALSESDMRQYIDPASRTVIDNWREVIDAERLAEDKVEQEAAHAGAIGMVRGLSFKNTTKEGKSTPGATIGAIKLAMQQMHADIVNVSEQVAQVMVQAKQTHEVVSELSLNSTKILVSTDVVEEKQNAMEINVEAVYQAVQNLATASANMEAGGWSQPGGKKQTYDFTRSGSDRGAGPSGLAGIAPLNPLQQDAIRDKIADAARRGRKLTITTNVETEQETWERERKADVGIQGIRNVGDRGFAGTESSKFRADKLFKDSL